MINVWESNAPPVYSLLCMLCFDGLHNLYFSSKKKKLERLSMLGVILCRSFFYDFYVAPKNRALLCCFMLLFGTKVFFYLFIIIFLEKQKKKMPKLLMLCFVLYATPFCCVYMF